MIARIMTRFSPDTKKALAYDHVAEKYDCVVSQFFIPPATDLVEQLRLPTGGTVLDVGAGSGAATIPALEAAGPGGRVIALDPSEEMLRICRSRGARDFVIAIVPETPFRADCFDAVFANFVLSHFPDHKAALTDLARTLKPGSRIGFTSWRAGSDRYNELWGEVASRFVDPERLAAASKATLPWEDHFYEPDNIEKAFEETGFVDIQVCAKTYPIALTKSEFVTNRQAGLEGRFLKHELDDGQWRQFLAEAEAAVDSFDEPFEYERSVNIATATKPD